VTKPSALESVLDTRITPCLAASRDFSVDLVAALSAALWDQRSHLDAFETIAVAGSLGRLEAGPQSDIDSLLVVRDGAPQQTVRQQQRIVMRILGDTGLKLPKRAGIYRIPVDRATLLNPAALGSLDEAPEIFGKRMQFLLDARPLLHLEACRTLQADIVRWYGSGFHQRDAGASWTYLINDLVRYLHAYAGWQQYKLARTGDDSWQLRQAKLRSSRMLTFAGLMVLLGTSNDRSDKQSWLLEQLAATPLERVAGAMLHYDDAAWTRLLVAYEYVHGRLSDRHVRTRLVRGGPDSLASLGQDYAAEFEKIRHASAVIMRELTNFILDRRNDWDTRFFARLIF
jgi:hypothetical protein